MTAIGHITYTLLPGSGDSIATDTRTGTRYLITNHEPNGAPYGHWVTITLGAEHKRDTIIARHATRAQARRCLPNTL